jgi:hypothetical protein
MGKQPTASAVALLGRLPSVCNCCVVGWLVGRLVGLLFGWLVGFGWKGWIIMFR